MDAASGSFRKEFLEAIDSCLKLRAQDRPRTIGALRDLLHIAPFTGPVDQTVFLPPPPPRPRSFLAAGIWRAWRCFWLCLRDLQPTISKR